MKLLQFIPKTDTLLESSCKDWKIERRREKYFVQHKSKQQGWVEWAEPFTFLMDAVQKAQNFQSRMVLPYVWRSLDSKSIN